MAEAAFDTLATARRLREGGFDQGQAEAIAVAIREGVTGGVATKADVAELRGEIAEIRGEIAELRGEAAAGRSDLERVEHGLKADLERVEHGLKADLERVEHGLKADLERVEHGLKADLKSEIAAVRGEIDKVRFDMTWRLLGGVAVLNGLLFLALRGLP